jgi:hypothetical protein
MSKPDEPITTSTQNTAKQDPTKQDPTKQDKDGVRNDEGQNSKTVSSGRLPLWLGYAGLFPMVGVLAGQWFLPQYASQLLYLAMLYVGAIFAFLGGIQWGLSLRLSDTLRDDNTLRLLISVLPALITVIALVIPQAFGCLLLGLGLWALLCFEWANRQSLRLPVWYLPLRINLTVLLSGSLTAALWLG